MKYLENELLIPFNIPDKYGMWYDINSYNWNKLEGKSLLGQIGDSEFGELQLTKATHSIFNIQIKNNGVYGDIRILDISGGNKINDYLDNNIELVFRNSGLVSYDDKTKYCELLDLLGFNAILKTNDVYDDIIYRKDKLHKIKNNINSYEN